MIAIIDYGMGNLRSVQKGFEKTGHEATVTSDAAEIEAASKVVLPGVGAFGDAMDELRHRRLVEPIRQSIAAGKPFLGICLGLQLLFEVGHEGGRHEGLGVLPGEVVRFDHALPRGELWPTHFLRAMNLVARWRATPGLSPVPDADINQPQEHPTPQPSARASNRGFLPMSLDDYLALLDWTGRQVHANKPCTIPAHLRPILDRLAVNTETWLNTITSFGRLFHRAVGRVSSMAARASRSGKHWFQGTAFRPLAFD